MQRLPVLRAQPLSLEHAEASRRTPQIPQVSGGKNLLHAVPQGLLIIRSLVVNQRQMIRQPHGPQIFVHAHGFVQKPQRLPPRQRQ